MPSRLLASLIIISAAAFFSLAAEKDAPPSAKDDHKALQGKWERKLTSGDADAHGGSRAVKEISGARERVTYYNDAGEPVHVTTADFSLEDRGLVRTYTYTDFKVEKGKPEQDAPKGPVSYIYRVDGDLYHEAHGLLTTSPQGSKPVVVTWKRTK
jgi:hypothetical protein